MKDLLKWLALPFAVVAVWYLVWLINSRVIADVCFAGNTSTGISHWIIEFTASSIGTAAAISAAGAIAPKGKDITSIVVSIVFVMFSIVSMILAFQMEESDVVAAVFANAGSLLTALYFMIKKVKDND